jgi:4-aminobutyrate aminotransferase/(S)-3-amino-2-methylpropionate transaminase
MRARMVGWQERFDEIGDVRGLGAMLAIELVHDRDSKDPAPELVSAVCDHAFRNGLLLLSAGTYANVVRVLVPLTIADAELEEALSVWEQALEQALR